MMSAFDPPLRPPGALPEKDFLRLCVRCGQCIEACPHRTLVPAPGFGRGRRAPVIEPKERPCQLCLRCVPSCPAGALDQSVRDMKDVRMGQAYILESACHNYTTGIMCMTCYDRCPLRGRAVILNFGYLPAMTDACAGCGVCEHVCPVNAVRVMPVSNNVPPPSAVPTLKAPEEGR
ncbi:MAG: 4Fe-4S dicluster domain-containing protein [Desulfovibrionaceae bacterium]|nr:4Fe-4S dicluster domain-containing protein [Desulfovibrionaceae bacterium]